jgi:hypothetical protein
MTSVSHFRQKATVTAFVVLASEGDSGQSVAA